MKGKIYMLRTPTNKVYIGQTIKKADIRLSNHKSDYENWKKGKQHYKSSYRIIEEGDFVFEILEEVDFVDINELRKKEQFFIDLYREKGDEVVNKFSAYTGITGGDYNKEYYKINKEILKAKKKEKYDKNRDEILLKRREAYKNKPKPIMDCVCGKNILKSNMKRHLKICQNNFVEDALKETELEKGQIEENTIIS